ncbi:hypothetical protein RCL1_005912 [Eukaryota sp. TZLM3-RCL]
MTAAGCADDTPIDDSHSYPSDIDIYNVDNISIFSKMLTSTDVKSQIKGAYFLRKILSSEDFPPPIDEVLASKCVTKILAFLKHPNEALRYESSWVVANIASGTSTHVAELLKYGAVNRLLKCAETEQNLKILDNLCWSLGNIAGDCQLAVDFVIKQGSIPVLIRSIQTALDQEDFSVVQNAVWAITNCFRRKPIEPMLPTLSEAIPMLLKLFDLGTRAHPFLSELLWAVTFFTSENSDPEVEMISCIFPRVVEILQECANNKFHPPTIVVPGIRVLGNAAGAADQFGRAVIDAGFLPIAKQLFAFKHRKYILETLFTVSNLAAADQTCVKALFDQGIVSDLLNLLQDEDDSLLKEALFSIVNLIDGAATDEQIDELVDSEFLSRMSNLITHSNRKIQELSMHVLARCVEHCLCVEKVDVFTSFFNEFGIFDKSRAVGEENSASESPNSSIKRSAGIIQSFHESKDVSDCSDSDVDNSETISEVNEEEGDGSVIEG